MISKDLEYLLEYLEYFLTNAVLAEVNTKRQKIISCTT
jgi:hypothetical protein